MSPRSTPSLPPRRRSTPSYMQPTKASEARANCAASPKPSSSIPFAREVTPKSTASVPADTVRMAVVENMKAQQEVSETLGSPKFTNMEERKHQASETTAQVAEDFLPVVDPITPTTPIAPAEVTDPAQSSEPTTTGPADDTTPDDVHMTEEVSKKRKRPDDAVKKSAKSPGAIKPEDNDAERSGTDEQPIAKKRKTRSDVPSSKEFVELGTGDHFDDDVVVTQRKRKSVTSIKARATKTAAEESKTTTKATLDPEFDRMIKAEEKRKAAAAQLSGNVFARNPKLRRSFADTMAASIMSRPNQVMSTTTVVTAPKPVRRPIMKDSCSAEVAPGAVTYDGDMIHADLRSIKYINVTHTIRNVHISRIVENPFAYPNVSIDFDNHERPIMAHITKMTDDEYKIASDAALGREKEKRKLDAKLARQNKNKTGTGKNPKLHKMVGTKAADKSSLREGTARKATASTTTASKATAGKTTEKSSLNKVVSGKITRHPRKSGSSS
ncbi:hypothetical protein P171DRAFT_489108 [Karstenula rhodostoma CBS 690.94]|uniref:Uncharacterized protein n=1 Tax=Karstenula rhodostoma CBS 690.94 TaxID=1392251 RepID=A0A9P4U8U0_9PLEO|nr:hypothetical protein P171DRAFT_489108 [Karstenula rhodostoma CBS 690.94]